MECANRTEIHCNIAAGLRRDLKTVGASGGAASAAGPGEGVGEAGAAGEGEGGGGGETGGGSEVSQPLHVPAVGCSMESVSCRMQESCAEEYQHKAEKLEATMAQLRTEKVCVSYILCEKLLVLSD